LGRPWIIYIAGGVSPSGKNLKPDQLAAAYKPAIRAFKLRGSGGFYIIKPEEVPDLFRLTSDVEKASTIFEPGAKVTTLAADGAGGEGPAWDPKLGVLTSGDKGIHQLLPSGFKRVIRENAGTNGLLFDREGRLVCCEPAARVVSRIDHHGKRSVVTDSFGGKKYNTPNDLTIDSKDRIYFSDPRYGPTRDDMEQKDHRGDTIEGVYRIDTDGKVSRVIGREVDRANGVLVSADDRYLFVADNNDISDTLRQAVDDGNGYYLLAYQPVTTTFAPGEAKFHSISVRLKRPDLRVRSRTGFYGTPDRGTPQPRTPIEQITRALTSPFATGNVRVRLTTLFSQSEKQGPYVNALLHIDANDLTFNQDADGFRTTTVDIAAVTFDADGNQIEGASKTWRFRLPSKTHEEVLRTGLVYSLHVPVKKAGAYQMRLAVRDNASQLLGSASQFIEVPDVKKGRLTLSGLVLGGDRNRTAEAGEPAEGALLEEDANSTPAVRIFKQGMTVVYGYGILNARTDRNKKTQLEVQTRLFRDGQEVFASPSKPLSSDGQPNPQRLVAGGRLQLAQLAPGDYALQVIVTDKLASEKNRVAAQSMDFEVR
jgi:hypothetical protein